MVCSSSPDENKNCKQHFSKMSKYRFLGFLDSNSEDLRGQEQVPFPKDTSKVFCSKAHYLWLSGLAIF